MSSEIQKKSYKHAIIIPTCAKPHIEFKFLRLLKNLNESTIIVYSINPIDIDQAEITFEKMGAVQAYAERYYGTKYDVVKIWEDGPTSFGEACNAGYEYVRKNCIDVESITFLNDDVDVTSNWHLKLFSTLNSDVFFTNTLLVEDKKGVSVDKLPLKIGFAGPLSNNVGSEQRLTVDFSHSVDEMAHHIQQKSINQFGQAKNLFTAFISGFCLMCKAEMLEQIYDNDGFIFDPIFKVGGFEDNDLIVRARMNGWGCLIDQSTYIGHDGSQTLDSDFQEMKRGMVNQALYLKKWKSFTQRKQNIIGAYRVAILNVNNLAQMGSSLRINHKFVDGMAILLTNNPAQCLNSYDKALFKRLRFEDQEFLSDCQGITDPNKLAERFKEWILLQTNPDFNVNVECWDLSLPMNERDERNYNYSMATDMGADWVISIDSDECFEDRLLPEDIRKLSNDPDPITSLFTFGWLNHYESMNVIRNDPPFCNGWLSGMNGVRMWRVWNNKHFPIVGGNEIGFHCGNAPEYGLYGMKGTGIRFRHMSMVREIDRQAKTSFYNHTDKDKDVLLIGNENYNHIKRSQAVPITLYRRNNGIGFFNLSYDKENPVLVADKIRNYNGLCKNLIVWTSEWNDEDMGWRDIDVDEFPSEADWRSKYPTGPDWFTAVIGKLHQVDFIYSSIDNGLAECRNAGLKHFKENYAGRIGWALYLDPDEFPETQHHSQAVASFRRMAEATDTLAFKFSFSNISTLRTGKPHKSNSESMRLIKLEPHLPVYFYGNVHETLEKSLNELKTTGAPIFVEPCPIKFMNTGLNKSPEEIAAKLEKYQSLLVKSLSKDPFSSASWASLAMTYEQDKDDRNAEICHERACLTAGTAFLPFQALGLFYARKAVGLFYAAMIRTKAVPELHNKLGSMFETLRELVGEFPVLDDGGACVSSKFELPPFPYDKIVYDEDNNQMVRREEVIDGPKSSSGFLETS